MTPKPSTPRLTRAEQETETEAKRLTQQVEEALAIVTVRSVAGADELEARADRVERAARDFVVALRELVRERRTSDHDSN
ncbi:MAG TPA: hypothetical protein VK619_06465 [Pyrinomonadaceae bacterium]|nr:hypothetical protein [Pyrinomonadaceae bacterium]